MNFVKEITLEQCHYEHFKFLSGIFNGLQLRWSTVDKEGFANVSMFQRLDYLWGGVHIYFGHQNKGA